MLNNLFFFIFFFSSSSLKMYEFIAIQANTKGKSTCAVCGSQNHMTSK
jgi:hypothetical protein